MTLDSGWVWHHTRGVAVVCADWGRRGLDCRPADRRRVAGGCNVNAASGPPSLGEDDPAQPGLSGRQHDRVVRSGHGSADKAVSSRPPSPRPSHEGQSTGKPDPYSGSSGDRCRKIFRPCTRRSIPCRPAPAQSRRKRLTGSRQLSAYEEMHERLSFRSAGADCQAGIRALRHSGPLQKRASSIPAPMLHFLNLCDDLREDN